MEENKVFSANNETFWKLINRCEIIIPKMQRNYSQGMISLDINQKRDNLLNDIFNSLCFNRKIDLNFIYGNISDNVFQPIDGQQRLTTLFLLYWYFMVLTGNNTDDNKKILKKFKYETKIVTASFCENLIDNVNLDLKCIDKELTPIIKDYYWFFEEYKNDISIKSMLVMIDAIHKKVKEIGVEKCMNFWELLISDECPITFLFLNLDDIGLTDEIYIKMNGRGKSLTEFENFKAQLANYLYIRNPDFENEFLNKLNCEWSNFFWKIQYKNNKVLFDSQIMNLFVFMIFNDYIGNNRCDITNKRDVIRKTMKCLDEETNFEFTNRVFRDSFKTVYEFYNDVEPVNEDTFHRIYRLINVLAYKYSIDDNLIFLNNKLYNKEYYNENDEFEKVINNSKISGNYEDYSILYAEYLFLSKYSNDDGSFFENDKLTEWIRYVYNLCNAQRFNAMDDYYRVIKTIYDMVDNESAFNILEYSAKMTKNRYGRGKEFGFVDSQAKEESIKSNLILRDEKWKSIIADAENTYLDNQLISLLDFSGIETKYDRQMKHYLIDYEDSLEIKDDYDILKLEDYNYDLFKKYLHIIQVIFEKNGLKDVFEKRSIFRRSLLCSGGKTDFYLIVREGQCYSFLGNKDRDYSFKRAISDERVDKRKFFKELFDQLYGSTENDYISSMNNIITKFRANNSDSWKYYFIVLPEILDSLDNDGVACYGHYVFREECRFINIRNFNEILLCEGKSTRSMNREFYSFVLYILAKRRQYNVEYQYDYRETSEKYLSYIDQNDKLVKIIYGNIDNDYRYIVKDDEDNIVISNRNIDIILRYINNTINV